MSNFGNKLRLLRKEKGLTQKQLADKLGLAFSTISMYERGDREPDFEILESIADFFNVSMDYLSMGMSGDFEDAISCGANMVRIGSAIFGLRPYMRQLT